MTNKAKQVATEFLKAVQQMDTEKLGALLHPDVIWSQPGNNSISGIKHSSAEVFEMVGKMFEFSANTLKLEEIKLITVNENNVACLLSWKAAKPTGEVLAVENIDKYTIENAKIIRVEVFTADQDQEDKFWSGSVN